MEELIKWFRGNSKCVVLVHKLCDYNKVKTMLKNLKPLEDDVYDDDDAHVLAIGEGICAYRVYNHVWIIPATVRTIFAEDSTFRFYFDYPCEMKVEDLIKY